MPWQRAFTAGVLLLSGAISNDADALAQRTFVASSGADTNNCAITQPCRSFASAIALTAAGDEVIVLDSAGYGPVTITQSVSIIAPPGVYAGISASSGDGVVVTAGPGDKVVLRGLTINGQRGTDGIAIPSGGAAHIENCVVANMSGTGIFVFLSAGNTRIEIRNTSARSNGGAGLWVTGDGTPAVQIVDSQFALNGYAGPHPTSGIEVTSGVLTATRVVANDNATFGVIAASDTSTGVVVVLTDSTISNNTTGGAVAKSLSLSGGTSNLSLIRSNISKNGMMGVWADGSQPSMPISVVVSDTAVTDNGGAGLDATGATTTVSVARSTIAGNVGPDLLNSAGVMRSSANNTLTGRGAADIQGTVTPNPPQ